MKLSEIKNIPITRLKRHPKNELLFRAESGKYFKQLIEDIRKRGIMVPLVAKRDGTILAGHNRLFAAKQIGLKTVPVQYIIGKISEDQEQEFMIKDNVLRRHLEATERFALYRMIVKNFDEKLMINNKGPISATDDMKLGSIAATLGIPLQTVKGDFKRMRYNKKKSLSSERDKIGIVLKNDKEIKKYKMAIARMVNTALADQIATIDELIEITELALDRLRMICEMAKTRKSS